MSTLLTASEASVGRRATRRGRDREARWRRFAVILLSLASLAPPVAEMVTTDRAHYVEGAITVPRLLVEGATVLSDAGIALVAASALLLALLWSKVDGIALVILSLPSFVMTANEFLHARMLGPSLLLPAAAGALVVILRVKFADLALLGYIGATVAAVSMIGMIVDPAAVLMSAGLVHAEKSITGAPLLAGIFSHSNILGLFLAASLPFAFLAKHFFVRWTMIALIVGGIILSSSRTALFGAGVVLAAVLLGWVLPRPAFRVVLPVGLLILAVFVVRVPFTERDPSAYTFRGEIWMYNIDLLPGHWLLGQGSWYYGYNYGQLSAALSTAASHAHNALLTALVMGGLTLVGAILVVLWFAWRGADRLEDRRHLYVGGAFLLGVFALSVTETTLHFAAWEPLSTCFLVPLFVLVSEYRSRRASEALAPVPRFA